MLINRENANKTTADQHHSSHNLQCDGCDTLSKPSMMATNTQLRSSDVEIEMADVREDAQGEAQSEAGDTHTLVRNDNPGMRQPQLIIIVP